MVGERTDSQKALILAQLNEGSEYLENQKEALGRLWKEFRGKVVSFYETEPMEPVQGVCRCHPNRSGGLKLTLIASIGVA